MTGFLQTYRGIAFGACFTPMALVDFFVFVGIAIYLIILHQKKKKLAATNDINLPSYDKANTEEAQSFVKPQLHPSIAIALKRIRTIFFSVLLANFGWIVLMLTAFDILTIYAGMPILIIYGWFCFCLLVPDPQEKPTPSPTLFDEDKIQHKLQRFKLFWKNRVTTVMYHSKNNAIPFFGSLLAVLVVVFVLVFFTWGMCVAWDPIEVTTRFTRSLEPQVCTSDNDPPCHVYITYPETPSTSMIINFQTKSKPGDSTPATVYFDLVSHADQNLTSYLNSTTGKSHEYSSCDITRGINYVLITGLEPDTVYYFRAGYGDNEQTYSAEKKFRTPPSTGPFTFVAGGDMSVGDMAKKMLGFAAEQDPYFAAVGGDIAYANAFPSCYKRWDKWLDNWEDLMYMSDGSYIPMMLAIGNHEGGGFGVTYSMIPFYINWFAQSSVLDLEDRETYHAHAISNTSIFLLLDSNVGSSPNGKQLDWIQEQLGTTWADYPNRMATYHVPLYPSYRSPDSEPSKQLRDDWLPVFADYNLTVSFENHDHTYKRTKLLRNNQECELDPVTNDNTTCTLYMGDGAWGVTPRSSIKHRWYLAYTEGINHIMRVDVGATYMNISVLDKDGAVHDSTFKYFL